MSKSSPSRPASIALDLALGIGGIPRGRVTEIYGPESSGKTTLCLHIIANAQRRGGVCAIRRRRARARSRLRRAAGRQHQRPADLAAGHRRAGARDRRDAGAQRRGRCGRGRLGGRAGAARRDRGRDGRCARRPAGAPDEPGAAQADRRHQQLQDVGRSSPTSCARRSASCSATRRRRRADAR